MKLYNRRLCLHVFTFCAFLVCFLAFSKKPAFAVSVSITDSPSSISSDEFSVTASVSGSLSGTNYFRIDLYKDGSSKYFGETYNGSSWFGGSEGQSYFPYTYSGDGPWSISFKGRIGNPDPSYYSGPGTYKMRIRRYTSGGNQGSEDADLSSISVTISAPAPTNTPAPTPTNTPVPTSAPNPTATSVPTTIPSPTLKASISSVQGPVKPLNQTQSVQQRQQTPTQNSQGPQLVLGDSTAGPTSLPLDKITGQKDTEVLGASQSPLPFIFIGIGVLFLASCGILFYLGSKNTQL